MSAQTIPISTRNAGPLADLRHPVWSAPLRDYVHTRAGRDLVVHAPGGCGAARRRGRPLTADPTGSRTIRDVSGCDACGTQATVQTVTWVHWQVRSLMNSAARTLEVADLTPGPGRALDLRLRLDPTWAFAGDTLVDTTLRALDPYLDDHRADHTTGHVGDIPVATYRESLARWAWAWTASQIADHPLLAPPTGPQPHRVLINSAMAAKAPDAELHRQQPIATYHHGHENVFAVFAADDRQVMCLRSAIDLVWRGEAAMWALHTYRPWALPFGPVSCDPADLDALCGDATVWRLVLDSLAAARWSTKSGDLSGLLSAALAVLGTPNETGAVTAPALHSVPVTVEHVPNVIGVNSSPF